jgi:transcriptional regulator with XRE-family HTH domain
MGRKARLRPKRLAEKLRYIRLALGFSQTEMLRGLGYEDTVHYSRISEYELGKNEPPLPVLLAYARAANVSTDVLIDDKLDLPAKLPAKSRHRP